MEILFDNGENYINKNLNTIFLYIILLIFLFLLIKMVFWFSNKKRCKHKIKKAKKQLLDLIENMVINKESIDAQKLSSVFYAIARENNITLQPAIDYSSILQDLTLKFAISKYLSSNQKDEYIEKLNEIAKGVWDDGKIVK